MSRWFWSAVHTTVLKSRINKMLSILYYYPFFEWCFPTQGSKHKKFVSWKFRSIALTQSNDNDFFFISSKGHRFWKKLEKLTVISLQSSSESNLIVKWTMKNTKNEFIKIFDSYIINIQRCPQHISADIDIRTVGVRPP